MSDFYADMRLVAENVISEFQQGAFSYIAVTPGNGPPDNPGPPQETSYSLEAVARGVAFKYVNGSTVLQTDKQLTMAARSDVRPAANGFVMVDGVRHKIIQIVDKPAAGDPVAHTVIFRK